LITLWSRAVVVVVAQINLAAQGLVDIRLPQDLR